jgi:hypothetical protein
MWRFTKALRFVSTAKFRCIKETAAARFEGAENLASTPGVHWPSVALSLSGLGADVILDT